MYFKDEVDTFNQQVTDYVQLTHKKIISAFPDLL